MLKRFLGRKSLSILNKNRHIRCFSDTISNEFVGVWPIIATPFKSNDETINYNDFENIISFFTNKVNVNGVTITGVLGESNRLIESERDELIKIACNISSKPVCVGTSNTGTLSTIKLSENAIKYGAHSVMITPNKEPIVNQDKIIEYYTKINQALPELKIVLQDHPASTQVNMTTNTLETIVKECNNQIKCIKLESLPSPPKIGRLVKYIDKNNFDCKILTGLGGLYAIFDIESGSHGYMTGFAFPEILMNIVNEYNKGNINIAREIFSKYSSLIIFEQQPGVGIRKEIYKLRGLLNDTHVRHPGNNASKCQINQLNTWIQYLFNNIDITKPIDNQILLPK